MNLKFSSFLLILATFLSPWFSKIPLYPAILIILFAVAMYVYVKYPRFKIKPFFILLIYLLIFIKQISTTNISAVYETSGYEKYLHQQYLDSYPPKLYRIANIIENRLDSLLIFKLKQNFYNSLDLIDYFINYFLTFLFIPFLIGLIKYLQKPIQLFTILFFTSISLLTLFGTKGTYGPIILLPFIILLIFHYSLEK